MNRLLASLLLLILSGCAAQSQTNIISTNPLAEQIMMGNYNPASYMPSVLLDSKQDMIPGLLSEISTDSLRSYIVKLGTFYNRNTCADTVSPVKGVGAARRWVYSKFQEFSTANENRLIPSYLQYDQTVANCPMNRFRNIFAVLPGTDLSDRSVIIVEGHMDSRCEGLFDINCQAEGIEDNATGTALVMELSRVMSKYAYKRTIVFLVTIGEEQGLYGAAAFAQYAVNKSIKIKAVQNNDVIGGIICGKTASPPTECVSEGEVDSTQVRIFSSGSFNSPHKAYARFTQLQYLEEVKPIDPGVAMRISVMVPEDRTGRGGDHIPFRQNGFTAVRFTAAHEHGNASPVAGYTDRQHSFRDTLGVDTNNDGVIDSFFVSFSYLKRNTVINGASIAMAAIGPETPAFAITNDSSGVTIQITAQQQYNRYKVSVRRLLANYNLDLLYEFSGTSFKLPATRKDSAYYISVASIDSNDIESVFTIEQFIKAVADHGVTHVTQELPADIELNAFPNPSSSATTFRVAGIDIRDAAIIVTDISGRQVARLPLSSSNGIYEARFDHRGLSPGIYKYSLAGGPNILISRTLVITK
jgi:hypothetical protein